jgi:hypothetical protein
MSLQQVTDFMKENLTCPQDKSKCLEYINSLPLVQKDLDYARNMLERWISVGLFKKPLAGQVSTPVKMFKKPLAGQVSVPGPTTVQTEAPSQTPDPVGSRFRKNMFDYMEEHGHKYSSEERRETAVFLLQDFLSDAGRNPAPKK